MAFNDCAKPVSPVLLRTFLSFEIFPDRFSIHKNSIRIIITVIIIIIMIKIIIIITIVVIMMMMMTMMMVMIIIVLTK